MSTIARQPAVAAPAGRARAVAVRAQGVSKTFRLPHKQVMTLKERVLHPFEHRDADELHALNDVSFEVAEGEFFGIVGRNGSGKSTLLKCLAGIYDPDVGRVDITGKLSPFIELGVGFNPDLTARDNVLINAVMLGLSRRQARARFDEIVDFAELGPFIDLKLKNYSSGMYVRLAFSVAVQADADVLLVDEVLAVGDAAFQQKCFDQFRGLKKAGRTIVFVTHDMGTVERFCDRVMLLEHGDVVGVADPASMARRYHELNFGGRPPQEELGGGAPGVAGGAARIARVWFEDEDGRTVAALGQGERVRACLELEVGPEGLDDPVFAVELRNEVGHLVYATRSDLELGASGRFGPGERVELRFAFDCWLAPSRYGLTPVVAEPHGGRTLDRREDSASLLVHATRFTGGVVDLPTELVVQRA